MASLKGKSVFITGASRGIGLEIAKRVAREGAYVTIAAKTTEPHPKLPGTIYTAAEEVEKLGGKALPLQVDIRDANAIEKAVEETVKKFGGIDILVNNASAIWLKGTLKTDVNRFDLMNGINARGTWATTRICLPHLIKSAQQGRNPHVLMLSPPLSMDKKWFKDHPAYTMAKYAMSMCVLGFAEEFKQYGIAVNALWPRTGIATAAIEWVAGDVMMKKCRKPDIMSDAAFAMLTSDAKTYTGNFAIDDEVLRSQGVKDLSHYAVVPGTPEDELMPDFFLDAPPRNKL